MTLHTILFTGHMIDADDRKEPRFPKALELVAREKILKKVEEVISSLDNAVIGIASGACGGDILFHEVCGELGVQTEMYLASDVEEFKRRSVSFAGASWERRFDNLVKKLPVHVLPHAKISGDLNIWAAANLWMLDQALKNGVSNTTLIALLEQDSSLKEGGTGHFVALAKSSGVRCSVVGVR
jgi:hypothetical protein